MGFRDEGEAQRAKIEALERRVADLEGELEGSKAAPAADGESRETGAATREPRTYRRVPLVQRWLIAALILAAGPAVRSCASEPMALPALRVGCPTAEALKADVRSAGVTPSRGGGYSESLDVSWTCDGRPTGVLRALAGSLGWGLLAAAAFLLLAAAVRSLLPRAAWPLPALLATAAGGAYAWSSWSVDATVGVWAESGAGALLTWGAMIAAAALVAGCTDLAAPEGADPSEGLLLGLLMLVVGVLGGVPGLNVVLALAAFVVALVADRPIVARVAMALVAPALVAVPWIL